MLADANLADVRVQFVAGKQHTAQEVGCGPEPGVAGDSV